MSFPSAPREVNDELQFGIGSILHMALSVSEPEETKTSKTKKKPRTSFNKYQVAVLEECFVNHKYLASVERKKIAIALAMTDTQVKTWFQNRRTKWRRTESEKRKNSSRPSSSSSNFSPLTSLSREYLKTD